MAWLIRIDFDNSSAPSSLVHQVRNFGEDVWRLAQAEKGASIALEDIDRATDRLVLRVNASRRVRRMVGSVRRLLGEHHLAGVARVSVMVGG